VLKTSSLPLEAPQNSTSSAEVRLSVCTARDPKGIYRKAREGGTSTVPGLQTIYEPPEGPDLVVRGDRESPEDAAARVVSKLIERGYMEGSRSARN
jgi:adenylylsulfate kinase-like enzyme